MRICFLLGNISSNGGIARVTSIIANALSSYPDLEVYILNFNKIEEKVSYKFNSKIKIQTLFNHPLTMSQAIKSNGIKKLRKYLISNKINVLIACGSIYFPLAILSTILSNVKNIGWEHSNAKNNSDHKYQKISRFIGAKFADTILTLTKRDLNLYKMIFKAKNIYQIYNPVDNSLENYRTEYNEHSKKIISVGRLSYQKNFENLVRVANNVLKGNPSWEWHIYGDGEEYESISNAIKKHSLTNRLILKGQVNDLYLQYPNYSFQVMTSRYEGFPMSLLEGLTLGLPLISYDIETGPNEIIENNVNGYLIPPFNEKLMSEKVESLIFNRELRKEMSRFSIEKSKKFKLNEIVQEWYNLIIKL